MKDTLKILGYTVLFIPFVVISITKSLVTVIYDGIEKAMKYCASAVVTE